MSFDRAEILIVGAGIIGLTIARELVQSGRGDIVIIEKETELGVHASGRNSGVLHAGIYYSPDSLKAKSCLNGNFLMRAYCKEKGLPLLENGKVIVTRTQAELPVLDELFRRATANGAKVEMIDEQQLAAIEPNARTVQRALFSHYTAVVDPKAVLKSLKKDLEESGKVTFVLGCRMTGLKGSGVALTTKGEIRFNRFVNAAGAYCNKVAAFFGVGENYRLIPFKGVYRLLKKDAPYTVNSSIYPVPDIRNPFLGVHFTRSVHGDVYLGPTAIPAFGRENYGIIKGIDAEAFSIAFQDLVLFLTNKPFRNVALTEPAKYIPSVFFKDAARLVKELSPEDVVAASKVGIRPQLVDWDTKQLVMDFLVVADGPTVHVLNPISPAFTSSMDLAQGIVAQHF
ncbi:L-2-hydroxyglutarate oxidase [Geomonas paludis]|uniref:Aminobutyraldehyde dehydrogenase n=1 Tax=Geomonas paludis TaxID=2740185 RepID=A0A6V8MZM3_9BACT|nr:L-2-hydroxyglutarate oxidase [Geomonas paludis]UPU34113.1 L-2-hydroxyglutarate oxidase [Geomonas paludis]GFO65612.1 aminobutyraldehyde dehydrogenase [Geomonas paludis]